jgi:CHASE2 domain-containing sensor protein
MKNSEAFFTFIKLIKNEMIFFIKRFQRTIKAGFFVLIILLGCVLLFKFNFSFLDSINILSEKVSFRDIYFSKIQGGELKSDERVVLIDIGDTLRRPNIVKLLYKIKEIDYKALGIDIRFDGKRANDPKTDSLLEEFALKTPKVIFGTDELIGGSFFMNDGQEIKKGLTNLGKEYKDFPVRSLLNNSKSQPGTHSFSYEIVKTIAPNHKSIEHFVDKKDIDINFERQNLPLVIKAEELLSDSTNTYLNYLENKIVIVGSMGDNGKDMHLVPNASYNLTKVEDTFYTDVSGPFIHAIMISNLLDEKIIKSSNLFNWLLFALIFIITLVLTLKFEHAFNPYMRLIARLYILVGSLLIFLLYIFLMDNFLFEFPVGGALMTLILTLELTEIYEPIELISKDFKCFVTKLFSRNSS